MSLSKTLVAKLDNLANIDLTPALTKACLLVENEAKKNCQSSVKTGELRNSITHNVQDNVGVIGTNIFYAPYVEFGTGIFAAEGNGRQDPWSYQDVEGNWYTTIGQNPQPFLEPALNDNIEEIKKIIADYVKKEVDE